MSYDPIPLSAAALRSCYDLSQFSRDELERLMDILRDELDLAQAQYALSRNESEIKAKRKAMQSGGCDE